MPLMLPLARARALSCLPLALLFAPCSGAEPVDFQRRLEGTAALPVYPVAYRVPTQEGVKQSLDRIRDHTLRITTLAVFDQKTGERIASPAALPPTAVVDQRYGGFNLWDYPIGVILAGFELIGEQTGDPSYLAHPPQFLDFIFDWQPAFRALEEQTGKSNAFTKMWKMHALDHCGAMGFALAKVQQRTPDPRFRAWLNEVDAYISRGQFRLADGTLARQRPQAVSLWTDDFYMSIPFLAQMGVLTGEDKYFDDAVRQVIQLSARLFDEDRGLYDHGWSEVAHPYDPRHYWGRANGWAAMATVELLTVLPKDHPGRPAVEHIFRTHMRGLIEVQDGTGLWPNMLNRPDTYLETSASAMFVFALARGINEGLLPAMYAPVALTGWNGVATRIQENGRVSGICEGTTYANDAVYYTYRGAGEHTNFFGAVLLAGGEVLRLLKNPNVTVIAPTEPSYNSAMHARPPQAIIKP